MNDDASPRRDKPEVSLQDLQAAAERGDPAAMYNLGLLYSKGGGGLPQDYVAALRWLDKATKKKFPPAYYVLGIHHFNGLGVRLIRSIQEAGFSDSFEGLDKKDRVTLPANGPYPDTTFDYIFHRGFGRRKAVRVMPPVETSDHRMVVVTLTP